MLCAAGEPSHALPHACLECMSHASSQHRLAALQPAAVDAATVAAFEQHMEGYWLLLLLLLLLLMIMIMIKL